MNLAAPIFDRVRIPKRESVAQVAEKLCAEHGVEREDMTPRAGRRFTDDLYRATISIAGHLRDHGFSVNEIAAWFGYRDASFVYKFISDAKEMAGE